MLIRGARCNPPPRNSRFGCAWDATQCEEVGDAGVLDAQWIKSGSFSSTSYPRACYLKLSGMKLYYNTVQPPLRKPPPPAALPPVWVSPAMTARWMGAAPRYFGSRLACTLMQPRRGALSSAWGRMRP